MEQRRTPRYTLQLPLRIVQLGEQRLNRTEKTRDISSSGISFLSPVDIPAGQRMEYVVTLSGSEPLVRIRCLGNVVRSVYRDVPGPAQYEIAVSMDRYQFVRAEKLQAVAACL